jgi:PAS domain S-box-containing protein
MRQLRVTTFGGLRLHDTTGCEIMFSTRKTAALVAYVAMHPERRLARDRLCGLFWADKSDSQARHSLSQALSEVRRTLGDGPILSDARSVWANSNQIWVDAIELPKLAKTDNLSSLEQLEAVYQGDFLASNELGQEGFDGWLLGERERLRQVAHRGLAAALALRPADADAERRLHTARAILALDPFDEPTHCILMNTLAAQGRTALAIRHYRRLSANLRRELGISPGHETVATFNTILTRGKPNFDQPRTLTQFAFVLEQLPHPVVVTDIKNCIVGWNRLAEETFGFTKGEICGRSPTIVYAPDRDQSLADSILQRAVLSGRWSGSVKMVKKDGQRCRQRRIVAPLYNPDGELIGAFGHGIAL